MGSAGDILRAPIDLASGKYVRDMFSGGPSTPVAPGLPAPVEDVDVAGQRQYTKQRLKQRQGRASTILTNKLGNANSGGRGVLG